MTSCGALTRKGERCKRPALADGELCAFHERGRMGGRPTLLKPASADQLVAMLRAGNYIEVAARAAGVSRSTFRGWMQRGLSDLEEDRPFRELRERVETALAEGEVRNVTHIAVAARDGDWNAAAWILERHYPDRWGRVPVTMRDPAVAPAQPAGALDDGEADPFLEIDQLAEQRRKRAAR